MAVFQVALVPREQPLSLQGGRRVGRFRKHRPVDDAAPGCVTAWTGGGVTMLKRLACERYEQAHLPKTISGQKEH